MIDWSYFGVPYTCNILLADVEAHDAHFAERYFSGDVDAFRARCLDSVNSTRQYLGEIASKYTKGMFISSSFFDQFGQDVFQKMQLGYEVSLGEQFKKGALRRVVEDAKRRHELNQRLYGKKLASDHEFIAGRTMRTMAQYLTLGRLIGSYANNLVIVHDTVNGSLFQQSNRFKNYTDDSKVETPVIIKRGLRVY